VHDRTRSAWPILAGVLLLLNGIGAFLLSLTLLYMSLMPPVAAIQGQAPVEQTQLGPALALLAFAVACVWAARRAFGRKRSMRLVGIVLATALVLLLASLPFTSSSMDSAEVAFPVVLVAIQALIILALVRWPADSDAPAAVAA
jgi:hypothetical protein